MINFVFFTFFLLQVAQGTTISYFSTHPRPAQCEEETPLFMYAYVPLNTMKQLSSILDGASWTKSGVLNVPSGSHGGSVGSTSEVSDWIKEIMDNLFSHGGKSNTLNLHDENEFITAVDSIGDKKSAQILAIDEDVLGKKGMLDALKVSTRKLQSHKCSAILFIEKGEASIKGVEKYGPPLFGDGLFAVKSGVGRVLSSSSSTSSADSLNMTPETLGGLILFASFLCIILVGLGCTNDIRGASSFTDEKSIPPVGKEA